MPIYEYRCATCGGRFEQLTSSAERARVSCPQCGAPRVERLLSRFAVGKPSTAEAGPGPCGSDGCACRGRDA